MDLPEGMVAVVKRGCPTCTLVQPVLTELAERVGLTVISQDDPDFPEGMGALDDRTLDLSWHLQIETVPTLLKVRSGAEVERTVGWSRDAWQQLSELEDLGAGLPDYRPGCGSRTLDPDVADELTVRYGGSALRSRRVEIGDIEDEAEAMFDRGWTDGLPVVAPTEVRVLRMLEGTTLAADEIVAEVPPDLVTCTVEKVAVNAVLAGCRPEHLPFVIAAVRGACGADFNMHGLLATTYAAGPILIANGPGARAAGLNGGLNALGQGNRANATIGRALQLVVRNVGGGRPGGVDRATQGNPGKVGLCFAEDEEGSPWEPLSVERGFPADATTITLFAGEGPRTIVDQLSREPESLARTLAAGLRSVAHPKLPLAFDAVLVVSPEHARVFAEAGWDKARLRAELAEVLQLPGAEIIRGAGGITEGVPESLVDATLPKFRDGGLLIVHAGGRAGMFSAIIGGWVNGETGSQPVTVEVQP